jgi:chromosome segregation ATPase
MMKDKPKFPLATPNDLLLSGEGSKAVANCVKAWSNLTTYWKERAETAEQDGRGLKEQISKLEAERDGLEACCKVLEKALGVPKKATLKQIDERIGYLMGLETSKKNLGECQKENSKLKERLLAGKQRGDSQKANIEKLKARLNELEG